MRSIRHAVPAAVLLAVSAVAQAAPAAAQGPADFFKGKQMSLIVYSTTGTAYDLYSRLLSRHITRHIPGEPTIIVKNMVGAGGLTATRYLYSQAPRDGTTFGTVSRGIPFEPLLGGSQTVDFEPLKFLWLGSMNKETSVAFAWHTAAVKTAKDLFSKELIVAGTGAGADSQIIPDALNGLLGTKFKIVSGYDSVASGTLAVERGEVQGFGYFGWGSLKVLKPQWLAEKKVTILFQTADKPHPDLPDVPLVTTLARNAEEKLVLEMIFARETLGRPFLAPPDVPADRAATLRAAFNAAMRDPQLLDEADKAKMEVSLVTGEEVEALLKRVFATPPAVVEKGRAAMNRK